MNLRRAAALAAWRDAGIPTAGTVGSADEIVPQRVRAAFATLASTDVTAARRFWTALELGAVPVRANLEANLVVGTNRRWILVPIGKAATLAAWGSTCVPAAQPAPLAGEVVAKGVLAAIVVVSSTDVTAALRSLGALELLTSAIDAGVHAHLQPRGRIQSFPVVMFRSRARLSLLHTFFGLKQLFLIVLALRFLDIALNLK